METRYFVDQCGEPPQVANASSMKSGTLAGDKAYYVCDAGYSFSSNVHIANITCQNDGWETPEACIGREILGKGEKMVEDGEEVGEGKGNR